MDGYDIKEIQEYYNSGKTLNEVVIKYGKSRGYYYRLSKKDIFNLRTQEENREMNKINRKPISEFTRKKISNSLTKYYIENPDKIPYRVYHSSNESYPEKYFTEVFENEKISYEKEYRVKNYSLDFVILGKKIDIEIDGDQHHRDKRVMKNDARRNEFLESEGWKIIRIKWSDFQRLNTEEKNEYIRNLKSHIEGLLETLPSFETKNTHISRNMCICGELKWYTSKLCIKCHANIKHNKSKINLTNLDKLLSEVEDYGYVGTGRIYGVSDNTIKKWLKKLNKEVFEI